MASPRTAWALALGGVLLIGVATLTPLPPGPVSDEARVQGERPIHLADGLRNVALFAPLGAGLAGLGWRAWTGVGLGLLLSAGIETAQSLLPGRQPDLGDVLSNALGTVAGHGAWASARLWARPPPTLAARLAVGSAALAGLAFAATGALFAPAPSQGPAFGHVPPNLAQLPPYRGAVRQASVAGVAVRTGALSRADAEALQRALRGDHRIEIEAVAAPRSPGPRGLLLISDSSPFEVSMVGVAGGDLQYRYLSRGRALGFDRATLRFPRLLAGLTPGETLRIGIERRGGGICARLGDRSQCRGYSAADGWRLLLGEPPLLTARPGLPGALWIAAGWLPLGFWSRKARSGAIALAGAALAGAGMAAAAWLGPVLPPPPLAWLGAATGLFLGLAGSALAD